MENRRKFYSSSRDPQLVLWSSDKLQERYKHIKGALAAYNNGALNKEDLKFCIKNAFVSKIYISEGAKNHLVGKNLGSLTNLYNQLIKNNVLDLQDKIYSAPNSTLSLYFDICKLGDKKLGVSIEHVVPGDVYLSEVEVLNNANTFDFTAFLSIFDKVSICIVTSQQAKYLDKKLRSTMSISQNINFRSQPFARYDSNLNGLSNGNRIAIHGWKICNGILIP